MDQQNLQTALQAADGQSDPVRPMFRDLRKHLNEMVIGQSETIETLLVAILTGGHVLLEGAPGLAKTRLARTLAAAFEGSYSRIQFTPDLLPSDLIGASIFLQNEGRFEFQKGPLFANFILADEINRAPAKVQSALLEAMEERQVTSGDQTYALEPPFFVTATQNPIEHEGTWDLPKAQLDRFVMQIALGYPGPADEQRILGIALNEAEAALAPKTATNAAPLISKVDLHAAQRGASAVYLSDLVRSYIIRLIGGLRGDPDPVEAIAPHIAHPASPRGTIMLARGAQARAWLLDRDHVVPEDVQALLLPILRHRIGLTYRAEVDGITPDQILETLIGQIDVL